MPLWGLLSPIILTSNPLTSLLTWRVPDFLPISVFQSPSSCLHSSNFTVYMVPTNSSAPIGAPAHPSSHRTSACPHRIYVAGRPEPSHHFAGLLVPSSTVLQQQTEGALAESLPFRSPHALTTPLLHFKFARTHRSPNLVATVIFVLRVLRSLAFGACTLLLSTHCRMHVFDGIRTSPHLEHN
jgi:hypothetical protein